MSSRQLRGLAPVVVPVGAPAEWFRPLGPERIDRLRVVFYGTYSPLQGAHVIGEAIHLAARRAGRLHDDRQRPRATEDRSSGVRRR